MAIPKVASTSILSVLPRHKGAPPTVPTFAFVRDPVQRFISGFQFLSAQNYPDFPKEYRAFVDRVLGGARNVHWQPQAELLDGIANLTLYRFEDLQRRWAQIGFPTLPVRNASQPIQFDVEYRINELLTYYRKDVILRAAIG